MVAGGDPQTAEAGAELLRAGGNAIDAIVAAAFAAFVCELPLCSPFGGGVMVVEPAGGEPIAFDMFARTPGLGAGAGRERDFEGIRVSFGVATQVFHVGRASVAVPLALAGLLDVHRRFGALPLADVLAPAIRLGRDGYVLGPGVAYVFQILEPIVGRTKECQALFVDESGATAKAGARLYNRDLASTLEDLAARPARLRELHVALADELSPAKGGLVTPDDVADLGTTPSAPVSIDVEGWRLSTMSRPSSGGVLVALGARMLEGIASAPFLSKEHVLLVARVQEALLAERRAEAFADRCADPAEVRALLGDERVRIAREKARNHLGSTTHLSAIDAHGNAVSLTLTNGEGSGHVVPGTGMIANNMLGEEDLHPRGFHVDPPGSSLTTMMAPTILSRGADRIALGSGGSNRLRTAILQTIVGLVEYGVSPDEAVHAPRLHLELGADERPRIAFEASGLAPDVASALSAAYPDGPAVFTEPNLYFGGVHLATRLDGAFEGVGDRRRSGARVIV